MRGVEDEWDGPFKLLSHFCSSRPCWTAANTTGSSAIGVDCAESHRTLHSCSLRRCVMLAHLPIVVTLILTGAGQVSVTDIPSPRPTGWVTDQTGVLRGETRDEVNRLCNKVNRESGAEMAVVVIFTTGGQAHRAFATSLFNHWGIGNAAENNGLMIFVALNDRRAEIILGDGIDSAREAAISREIMNGTIVPAFRRGDTDGAVVGGAWQCARRLLGLSATMTAEMPVNALGAPSESSPRGIGFVRPRGQRRDPKSLFIFLGIGGGAAVAGFAGIRTYLRYRRRYCPKCKIRLIRLQELQDDKHLGKSQRLEEKLRSVDYDVWSCPTCPHVEVLRYNAFFTRYKSCPKCARRTAHSTSRTLRCATETSTGTEEITERCENCSYHKVYTRTIPRKTSSSSNSSSSSRSSGFGGGRSSGRGASGGW